MDFVVVWSRLVRFVDGVCFSLRFLGLGYCFVVLDIYMVFSTGGI